MTSSGQFLLNCDTTCHSSEQERICQDGCNGGSIYLASRWLGSFGVVDDACLPYAGSKEKCSETCATTAEMKLSFHGDLCPATLSSTSVDIMKYILMRYGSLLTLMEVYSDLSQYQDGVYSHKTQDFQGYQAIRIVGWGRESNQDFWIVHNSWGVGWGNKGRLKIRSGVNECSIEDQFYFFVPCEDVYW
ncbi:putative Dipeptidyl peptidase 1 [Blattamonas nauphoetae]|uniref:Dipeptidyl peptidase 1 n=1 Tax=Blattamonas nauphoetae TaxID=2049346 RepID=A0ABQ9XTD5_9EUKA|nr:putative Dipeptidyl peptidase 1 [Blattamonas nauphoetae]